MIYFKQVCLVAVVVLVIILVVFNIEDWSAISTSFLEEKLGGRQDSAVIQVSRLPDMSSNETEFKVGERIYFRLINGNASEKVFWRFEHQYFIQGGVKFDTWDPKLNRDLEPLEQSSIDTGGFRIDAFFLKGTKYENAHQVIRFVKEDESYNSKTFTGGVTTYKGYIIVGKKKCKINPETVAVECPR